MSARSCSLPDPLSDAVKLREVPASFMAALKFSGETTEDIAKEKGQELRSSLIADGLEPKPGFMLARYNDPGRTKSFTRVSTFHCLDSNYSVILLEICSLTSNAVSYVSSRGTRY